MFKRISILYTFLFLCSVIVNAQVFRTKVFYEEDGLASSNVLSMAQSADGSMWFATLTGITQFDGCEWINHSLENPLLPLGKSVKIKSTPNGNIWLAGYQYSEFRLYRWEAGTWYNMQVPKAISHIKEGIFAFDVWQKDSETKIAIGDEVVYEYSLARQTWNSYPFAKEILAFSKRKSAIDKTVQCLKYSPSGKLWAGTHMGLLTLEGDATWQRYDFSKEIPSESSIIKSVAFYENPNEPYFIGLNWMGRLKKGSFELLSNNLQNEKRINSKFFHIAFRKNGDLLYSNNSPVFLFKPEGKDELLLHKRTMVSEWCTDILVDYEDNIWIGTHRGVAKLSSYRFETYNSYRGLSEDEVSAIAELSNGIIFMGSNHSLSILDEDEITSLEYTTRKDLRNWRTLRVLPDKEDSNIVYVAAFYKGLGVYNSKEKSIQWYSKQTINEVFFYQNQLYATHNGSIYRVEKDYSLTFIDSLSQYIRKVVTLPNGRTYLLASEVFEFKNEKLIPRYTLSDYREDSLYGLAEWNGEKYVATLAGLQKIERDTLIVPTELMGVKLSGVIYAMLVDSKNNLWIGGGKGVYLFKQDSSVLHFSKKNGLIGSELNRNALIEDSKGNIWIGTEKGVSVFDYKKDIENFPAIRLKLKEIITNKGQNLLPEKSPVSLPSGENSLEFTFVGVSFYDERTINYRYRLQGYDEEWETIPNNAYPLTRYTDLPHGTYRFEVQARRNHEPWSASVFSEEITIKRPFYSSTFFLLLLTLFIGGIGYLIHFLIAQQRNQQFLKQKVLEKVQEVASSEEELQTKNEELQALNLELDKFVYSVSHDLKAPLNSIYGIVSVLELANSEAERTQMIKYIGQSVTKLQTFIKDLEVYARNKNKGLTIEKVNFEILVKECIQTLQFSNEAQEVAIDYTIEQFGEFYSDVQRITIVINNLLSNAIRYRNPLVSDPFALVEIKGNALETKIRVTDNGIGIEAKRIDTIFNMFEKGRSNVKGSSGLGLFIVKETVAKLNGQVEVTSEVNKGTTFTITLHPESKPSKTTKKDDEDEQSDKAEMLI